MQNVGYRSEKENGIAAPPRYLQLKAKLLELIKDGAYKAGDRLPAEPQLAEDFGVSRMTANKAILELVAEGVLSRRKRHGTFVSDPAIAAQRECRPVVAVEETAVTVESDYFQGLYWALHDALAEKGVMLQTARFSSMRSDDALFGLDANPVITLGPPKTVLRSLLEFSRSGGRVLVIGASWQGYGMVAVDSDNVMGSALAVKHLADLGHRNIAFVGAQPQESNTIDRLRGFVGALVARGLPYDESRAIISPTLFANDADTRQAMKAMLSGPEAVTAIFAGGSYVAMEVLSICHSLGLRVPDDVSVVGYDDAPFLQRSVPAVTTIRQPLVEMAAAGVELALTPVWVEGDLGHCHVFNPQLVVRGSTAAPRQVHRA